MWILSSNVNHIHIDAPITSVYQYVTQPDKWHEWYPSSKSAKSTGGSLQAGEEFSEVVTIGRDDTTFTYVVVKSQTPQVWKVEYSSQKVVGSIQYKLLETIDGTLLTRTLEYFPVINHAAEHRAMRKLSLQVQPTSVKAMKQLKKNLETVWHGRLPATAESTH